MADEPDDEPGRVRPSATDIYESVKHDASEELRRAPTALAFSGLFAGATLGFSGLAAAAAAVAAGRSSGSELIGTLFYPVGFIAAIVGRAQLFTENTLYPVTLVLDERRHLVKTLRLWVIVLATNVLGTLLFAVLLVDSDAVGHPAINELVHLGHERAIGPWSSWLWSAVLAGWLLALVAWLIEASSAVIGQVVLIYVLTFVIGIAGLDHCVSTTAEVLAAVIHGNVAVGHFLGWLGTVVLGNVVGGVLIVALLNYGQVRSERQSAD
jgi:formate/nitrite transporter FocA (FNT family)